MYWELGTRAYKRMPEICKTDMGYYYIEFNVGRGYKKIWVNRKLISEKEGKPKLTTEWITYRETEKGNIVLLPSENKNTTVVILYGECGYRGSSNLSGTFKPILRGAYYHSPNGRLGISDLVLAQIKNGDIIQLKRTGRLYGEPANVTFKVIFQNNEIKIITADEESDSELKNLL